MLLFQFCYLKGLFSYCTSDALLVGLTLHCTALSDLVGKVDSENVGSSDITIACKSHRLAQGLSRLWTKEGAQNRVKIHWLRAVPNNYLFKLKRKITFKNLFYDFCGFLDQWHLQSRVFQTNISMTMQLHKKINSRIQNR